MFKLEELSFIERENSIRIALYRHFFVDLNKKDFIEKVGEYTLKKNKLILKKDPDASEKKIIRLFSGLKEKLKYKINDNGAVFIDENSNIPLIGLNFIGIVDKGSDMLEVKPITNCNADCSFCSVDEGASSKKKIDFVVDCDYLIREVKSILHFKAINGISIWINPHGEPTLYSKLPELIKGLINDEYVKDISIITNGLLLTKDIVDEMHKIKRQSKKEIKAAVSLSAINENIAKKLMGENYNPNTIINNLKYASEKIDISITPVLLSWMNEEEIEKIIRLSQELSKQGNSIKVQIQKFCKNKKGRNPIKEESWEGFFKRIKELELKTGCRLIENMDKIKKTPELPKVCEKGDKIKVKVMFPGRYDNEKIGIYESPNGTRAVLLYGCRNNKGIVKATVTLSKHNMIVAKCN